MNLSIQKSRSCIKDLQVFVGHLGGHTWVVDSLAKLFEQLPSVVVEVSLDLIDGLVLDDPQLTVGFTDEAFVVRYDDDSALKIIDGVGQCVDGLDIQVVGRLVKDQHVWRIKAKLSHGDAGFLATRKVLILDGMSMRGQSKGPQLFPSFLVRQVEQSHQILGW